MKPKPLVYTLALLYNISPVRGGQAPQRGLSPKLPTPQLDLCNTDLTNMFYISVLMQSSYSIFISKIISDFL